MTSCRPSRRASLPSLGGTTRSARVSLAARPSAAAGECPGVVHPVSPAGNLVGGDDRISYVPGEPVVLLPCSPTPAGPTHQAFAMRRRGPRYVHGEGSHYAAFEAQSHGFGTGCLRFAGRVTSTPRKTRFRLLARLFRTGLVTRRVPSKGFKAYPTSILLSQVQRSARTSLIIGPPEISDVPFSRPTIGIIVTNGLWGPGSVLGELEL
jgi:hypothetical protein